LNDKEFRGRTCRIEVAGNEDKPTGKPRHKKQKHKRRRR